MKRRRVTKRLFVLLAAVVFWGMSGKAQQFDHYFIDSTLRVDYHRIGCRQGDSVALVRYAVKDGCWAGSLTQLLDPFDNGAYRVMVEDEESGTAIYSRCYNSLFREYIDTPEGATETVCYEEVVNIPMPKVAVRILMQERDSNMQFFTRGIFHYNPSTPRTALRGEDQGVLMQGGGNPHTTIDIVIVAEGYGKQEFDKMKRDFVWFGHYLMAQEPFQSRMNDISVRCVYATGEESGITDPTKGIAVKSSVGSNYNTFGSDRYLMTFNLFQLHNLLAATPCDHIIIMANSDTYGGGAIYNFYAISSCNKMASMILPHELGHSIGGLADEYVDEALSYGDMHKPTDEPKEPNITTLVDFGSKWQALLPEGTAVPTPDNPKVKREENGPLGCYEGAGYHPKGIYRPTMHCMMRDYAPFCPVCLKRLNEVFDLYTQ